MLTIMIYPKCSTCKNAVKWFEENNISFRVRHIIDEKLSIDEIEEIHTKSGLEIKRFFNTSGMKYRELALKEKFSDLSMASCYELLASDGMLVKRPLVYSNDGRVTLGFKIDEYMHTWK